MCDVDVVQRSLNYPGGIQDPGSRIYRNTITFEHKSKPSKSCLVEGGNEVLSSMVNVGYGSIPYAEKKSQHTS